jgi:hypothetical protein
LDLLAIGLGFRAEMGVDEHVCIDDHKSWPVVPIEHLHGLFVYYFIDLFFVEGLALNWHFQATMIVSFDFLQLCGNRLILGPPSKKFSRTPEEENVSVDSVEIGDEF